MHMYVCFVYRSFRRLYWVDAVLRCLNAFSSIRVSVIFCLQLKELNHDNIKPFVGACVESGHICYLMQCCSRGTIQASPH